VEIQSIDDVEKRRPIGSLHGICRVNIETDGRISSISVERRIFKSAKKTPTLRNVTALAQNEEIQLIDLTTQQPGMEHVVERKTLDSIQTITK
jgi:fructose/tagatose bisphosphate aldolase